MRILFFAIGLLILGAGAFLFYDYRSPAKFENAQGASGTEVEKNVTPKPGRSLEERIKDAEEQSRSAKGVYMTSGVARDQGRAATKLRTDIVQLLDTTELNALVVDVKETDGGLILGENLRNFIAELHKKGVWVIARQVVFKDSSQEKIHPEWYLKSKAGWKIGDPTGMPIWRDRRRGSWLDQASPDVWRYQVEQAKKAIDLGFDEIQFDYIRFPSDGDTANIVYPVYNSARPRYEVLREFFKYLHDELKGYKPEIMLSADLFGYVAVQKEDLGIGQRIVDVGSNFDYVSLMVYPSHYYAGFQVPADASRGLPAIYHPYRSPTASLIAPAQPFDIIFRSMLSAADAMAGRTGTTSAARDEVINGAKPGLLKMRPWLQDFDLASDTSRGIYYDASMVRAQIDATEKAGVTGWLLWNAGNVYTKEALKAEN